MERQPLLSVVVSDTPRPLRWPVGASASADPVESLQSVRRAQVGRWWMSVRPFEGGFRASAHTIKGPPGVWAGDMRSTLAEATADAVAMVDELRRQR
jgi:hypothetical protein